MDSAHRLMPHEKDICQWRACSFAENDFLRYGSMDAILLQVFHLVASVSQMSAQSFRLWVLLRPIMWTDVDAKTSKTAWSWASTNRVFTPVRTCMVISATCMHFFVPDFRQFPTWIICGKCKENFKTDITYALLSKVRFWRKLDYDDEFSRRSQMKSSLVNWEFYNLQRCIIVKQQNSTICLGKRFPLKHILLTLNSDVLAEKKKPP